MNTIHDSPNEPLCLIADSDVPGRKPYRMEMDAFDGNGVCECPDFMARKWKHLKRGARSDGTKFQCKHLIRGHLYLSRKLLAMIKAEANKKLAKSPVHGSGVPGGKFRNAQREARAYEY
jgi:hypothetical protein